MAEDHIPQLSTAHPAPHSDRVRLSALWFGIAAAPFAWILQLMFSASLVGHACYPYADPRSVPLWSGLPTVLFAIVAAAFAVALSGGGVAFAAWRSTRSERPGSAHHLMGTGDGRTRFMAVCGMLTSAVFVIALAFGAAASSVVPVCGQ